MKNIVVLLVLFCFGSVYAQQEAQFASSFQNPYIYNPAAGGMSSVTQIDLIARLQWFGSDGPKTINFSGHSVVGIGNSAGVEEYNTGGKFMQARPKVTVGALKHVVGGKIISDEIGVFNRLGIYGSYAIHLPLTKSFNIGAGIGIGWGNYRINPKRVVLLDQMDDTYAGALGKVSQQHMLDATTGIVFYGKGLYFGASMTNAFKNKAKFSNIDTKSFYARHYFLNLSYGIKVGKSVLEPAVIAKFAAHTPVNLDFGARFLYKNAMWLGVYGRTSNNLVFQFGSTIVENIYISYSYEMGFGKLRNAASGSHEIQIGIYLGKRIKADKPADKKSKDKNPPKEEGSSESNESVE